jgi:hypothetical protein
MLYSPFSDAMVDWLSRDRVTAVIAANIQFESGTVYVHSGTGPIVLNGYVYYGMGRMGTVDDVGETNSTSPAQMKLTLSGLDISLFATTLNERCVGRQANIYLVAMDDGGVVRAADLIFKEKSPAPAQRPAKRMPCNIRSAISLKTGSDRSRTVIPMNLTRPPNPAIASFAMWHKWPNAQFTGEVRKMPWLYVFVRKHEASRLA